MVYYTRSSILVQRHAKGWHILCYSTSQYGLSVPHTAERNQWNTGANIQSTAGRLQTRWPSVVKTPHGQCTTKYKVGRMTGITSAQSIMVDRMPRYVKDLRPVVGPDQPMVCSDIVSENASERFVTIWDRPCEQAPSTNAGDASSNNTSNEDLVTILPRRSTRRKRPPPECFMCDHRIGGSVVVMPWTILPQRNRRCALSAASTWKSEEEKEGRGVTCFMEENEISLREVARFDEDKRLSLKWKITAFCWCLIGARPSVHFCKLSELTSVQ